MQVAGSCSLIVDRLIDHFSCCDVVLRLWAGLGVPSVGQVVDGRLYVVEADGRLS